MSLGHPECPDEVKRAKRAHWAMENKMAVVQMDDDAADGNDNSALQPHQSDEAYRHSSEARSMSPSLSGVTMSPKQSLLTGNAESAQTHVPSAINDESVNFACKARLVSPSFQEPGQLCRPHTRLPSTP